MIRRSSFLAAVLLAALAASGCSTVNRLNPFDKKEAGPAETAGEGQRISIIAADQRLEPAEALKGVDFMLPVPVRMDAWPLPGGNPEQAVGAVDAAPNLAIAWRKSFTRQAALDAVREAILACKLPGVTMLPDADITES